MVVPRKCQHWVDITSSVRLFILISGFSFWLSGLSCLLNLRFLGFFLLFKESIQHACSCLCEYTILRVHFKVLNYVCPCVSGRLNVQGRRAALIKSSSAELDGLPGTSSGSSSHDKPRVIEVEGLMEEYLAFDSRYLWVNHFPHAAYPRD